VARFIGQVAAAGKAEYPLPLYVNAALRDPLSQPPAGTYESGGPTDNVLDIWKAAAPAVDLLAPDIDMDDSARWTSRSQMLRPARSGSSCGWRNAATKAASSVPTGPPGRAGNLPGSSRRPARWPAPGPPSGFRDSGVVFVV
jgi:hypothetical protein